MRKHSRFVAAYRREALVVLCLLSVVGALAYLGVSAGAQRMRPGGSKLATVPQAPAAGTLLISEFRLRGPNGANDEFIEIYNNSGAVHTVTASSGTGYGVAASDGVLRCTIPNATVIPAFGHFLCTNSVGYSYSAYPAGSGTTATGNATYAVDIPDNAGIALFNTNIVANFTLANRFDAVGSSSEANTLYKEGTGYPALTPFSIEYSFVRKAAGLTVTNPPFGGTPTNGFPQDTDDNASDFIFVDTNGTSAGAGQRLGAPGPKNLSSPIFAGSGTPHSLIDTCSAAGAAPNKLRDFTSVPAQNSTFGTIDLRRTYTNNTGAPLTRLRFRILNIATFPAASGIADLRPISSAAFVVTVDRPPCGVGTSNIAVEAAQLEVDNTAPSTGQPNGGGFNSSFSASSITLGTPLANGASIDIGFLFGIQQTGSYKLAVIAEGLPTGGDLWILQGNTEDTSDFEGAAAPTTAGQLIISEFRLRGPSGANDEFVEIYNASAVPQTVADSGVGSGYAVAASDGIARCVIPNGTVIPVGGTYLCTNSVAYSLGGYAAGDATYATDIADNAGIALFNTSVAANFTLANRLDAVGSTSEANTLYKEGTGYPALTPFSIDYAFYRDTCGKGGSITTFGPCTINKPKDTDNNAVDFVFVDTNGTSAGAGQRLGAPGPQNLASPKATNQILVGPVDPACPLGSPAATCTATTARDFTSVPAQNSTFGTTDWRLKLTNNTGANVTRLRVRVVDLTTFPAPSGFADYRPITSSSFTGNLFGGGTTTVQGTTLEQPPSQPNGGGYNTTMGVGTVTVGTPLAPGASVNVHILLGIQQTGKYKIGILTEASGTGVSGATAVVTGIQGTTDVTTAANVTISGRVVNAAGAGLRSARVTISDSRGNLFTAITNAFGYYSFSEVPSGDTYIANASARGSVFGPRNCLPSSFSVGR